MEEHRRAREGPQGAEMVQLRWMAVGGVENGDQIAADGRGGRAAPLRKNAARPMESAMWLRLTS